MTSTRRRLHIVVGAEIMEQHICKCPRRIQPELAEKKIPNPSRRLEQIEPLIEGLPLVAHNARFDEGCLRAVFRCYQMDYPEYDFYDTLAASSVKSV